MGNVGVQYLFSDSVKDLGSSCYHPCCGFIGCNDDRFQLKCSPQGWLRAIVGAAFKLARDPVAQLHVLSLLTKLIVIIRARNGLAQQQSPDKVRFHYSSTLRRGSVPSELNNNCSGFQGAVPDTPPPRSAVARQQSHVLIGGL